MTSCAKMLNILMLAYNRKSIYCDLNSVKFPSFWFSIVKMTFPLKIFLEFELTFRSVGNRINIIMYCAGYFSIGTSEEDGTVGRLLIDSKYFPKARMKKIVSDSRRPYLCLFAIRDIDVSEKNLYFYGEENLPWHEQVNEIN